MEISDFKGQTIQITDEAIEHIGASHPEMTIEEIKKTLQAPDEVRKSLHTKPGSKCLSELYYRLRTEDPKRYSVVVVKFCTDGNWISTAYTGESFKQGELVYKKEEEA